MKQQRKIDFKELFNQLKEQQIVKKDLIVPSKNIRMVGSEFIINEVEDSALNQLLANSGVDPVDETTYTLNPLDHFHNNIAAKLDINNRYYKKMNVEKHLDLLNANVNYWLGVMNKSYMLRTFLKDNGDGIARAFLSNSYKIIDNLDILSAVISALGNTDIICTQADISDTNMYVVFENPNVKIDAGDLLDRYNNPQDPNNRETGFTAGFTLRNSEVGQGSYSITPRGLFVRCGNGQTSKEDAKSTKHLGARLDDGQINWSDDTIQKHQELIMCQTKDVIKHFMTEEYLQTMLDKLRKAKDVEYSKPMDAVRNVSKDYFGLGKTDTEKVLEAFIRGNDNSGLGVIQAHTWFAHETYNPDLQHDIENKALVLAGTVGNFDYPYKEKHNEN
jgi:hypothetical protein